MKAKPEKFEFAHRMRLNPTAAERKMWQLLRRKSLGVRVHRQKVKYGYILDFYIPKMEVNLEIDGKDHDSVKDQQRAGHLLRRGIRTIRLTNEFVMGENPKAVFAAVVAALKNLEG